MLFFISQVFQTWAGNKGLEPGCIRGMPFRQAAALKSALDPAGVGPLIEKHGEDGPQAGQRAFFVTGGIHFKALFRCFYQSPIMWSKSCGGGVQ